MANTVLLVHGHEYNAKLTIDFPSPPWGRGMLFSACSFASRDISHLLRGENVDRDRRSHQSVS